MNRTGKTRSRRIAPLSGTTVTYTDDVDFTEKVKKDISDAILSPTPAPTSPQLTGEESMVMRSFAAGKSDKQVRNELRIPLQSFHRLLRDLSEKTRTRDRVGLLMWALRRSNLLKASRRPN
jgi:DNA-binding NarL/FixJ family response regulator